jgi:hypothetical protein
MSDLHDLARHLVTLPRWGWMPGMRVGRARGDGLPWLWTRLGDTFARPCDGLLWLPDLTDPATLGCLLALVREAWGDPTITTHCWRVSPAVVARTPERGPERWSAAGAPVEHLLMDPAPARDWQTRAGWDDTMIETQHGARCPSFRGPTEAAALVAALDAAP